MEPESSSDEQWQKMIIKTQNHEQSLFDKTKITLKDETILENIEQENSKPIYHLEDPEEQQTDVIEVEQNQEALYDPLQDEENQKWIEKKLHKEMGPERQQRPLGCPACFAQIALSYQIQNQDERLCYNAKKVYHLVVDETKIIRSQDKYPYFKWDSLQLSQTEKALKSLEENFNVKILCFCECGAQIGYYNVHRDHFTLFNVI